MLYAICPHCKARCNNLVHTEANWETAYLTFCCEKCDKSFENVYDFVTVRDEDGRDIVKDEP